MSYVPAALRFIVIQRADGKCEYCLYPQTASFLAFKIEHIIAEKHGGKTVQENLALACPYCNRFKGSDLGSLDPESGLLISFFNPRAQRWSDHFRLVEAEIMPLTPSGRVTTIILQFNHPDRVIERQQLLDAGTIFPLE